MQLSATGQTLSCCRSQKVGLSIPYTYLTSLSKNHPKFKLTLKLHATTAQCRCGFTVHGQSPTAFIYNTHNCHPFQANDDISGVAVLIRLFQELAGREIQSTYTLLIGPELFALCSGWQTERAHIEYKRGNASQISSNLSTQFATFVLC